MEVPSLPHLKRSGPKSVSVDGPDGEDDTPPSFDDVPPIAPVKVDQSQTQNMAAFADSGNDEPPVKPLATQTAYQNVAGVDPERAAKVISISKASDQPPEFVDKNLPQIEKAGAAPPTSFFAQIEQNYPGTTEFLKKPENMAVTHDDLPNVAQHEALVQNMHQASGYLDDIKMGFENSVYGLKSRGAMPDITQAPDATLSHRLLSQASTLVADLPVMGMGGLVGSLAGPVGAAAGSFAFPAMLKQNMIDQYTKGDVKNISDLFDRASDITIEGTKQAAVGVATMGAGVVGKLGGDALGTAIGGFTGKAVQAALPLASEVAGMTAASKGVEGQVASPSDYLEGALMVGAMHGAGAGVEHLLNSAKTDQSQQFYRDIGQVAQDSKLRERMPEAHQDLVNQLTKDTPVENVYMPVQAMEEYFQSKKMDPAAVAEQLGVSDSYNEAKATGGDVKVPLSTWTDKIVGTEHQEGLANDIKFSPDDFTRNELSAKQDEVKNAVTQADQAAQAESDKESKLQQLDEHVDSVKKIHEAISKQLEAAGLTPQEVDVNPELHAAFFKRLGDQMGVDPYELSQRYGLKIEGPNGKGAEVSDAAQPYKQDVLKALRSDIESVSASPGGYKTDHNGTVDGRFGSATDGPSYFAGKGIRKADALSALDKAMSGKKLTDKQSKLVQELYSSSGYDQDFKRKGEEPLLQDQIVLNQAKNAFEKISGTNILDASEMFKKRSELKSNIPAQGELGNVSALPQAERGPSPEDRLQAFAARYNDEKVDSAIKKAQSPKKGPYVSSKDIPGIGFTPNYSSEPTGEIGKPGISQPHGSKNQDPLLWADMKHEATKKLIEEHAKENKAVVINTSSDLIAHDSYIEVMPKDTTVNMYMLPEDKDGVVRSLFPGNPSRGRQESAVEKLREQGVKVNTIEPTKDSLIEAAGGQKKVEKLTGLKVEELNKHLSDIIGDPAHPSGRTTLTPAQLSRFQEKLESLTSRIQDLDPKKPEDSEKLDSLQHEISEITSKVEESNKNSRLNKSGFSVVPSDSVLYQAHGNDEPRGRIRFGTDGSNKLFHIDLLQNADKSTFLHETGHYFLEVMHDIATKDDAHPDIKNDYSTIREWLGAKDDEKLTRDQHEQFARGFEQYLRNGEAPSEGLRGAFSKFRDWLVKLYKDASQLNVKLSPEVKEVMDRMLASKEEIEQAKSKAGISDAPIPGSDEVTQKRIQTLQDKARQMAETELLKPQMEEIKQERKEFLSSERDRLTKEAESEVRKQPLYEAMGELKSTVGPKKYEGLINDFLDGTAKTHDAAALEEMAEVHGFKDGTDLANQIKNAAENKTFENTVQAMVDKGMEPHASLMDTPGIKDAAMKAIHSDKMTELLALEHEALSGLVQKKEIGTEASKRNRIEAKVTAEAAKAQAKDILSKKPISEAGKFQPYVTAERNAAVKVAKAIAKGDYEKAAEFKRQQMLNHALASESMRVKSEIQKTVDRLTDLGKRGNDMKDMPYGFIRQVDQLLSRNQITAERKEDIQTMTTIAKDMAQKGELPEEIANTTGLVQGDNGAWNPESLPDFSNRVNDNYYSMILPDSVMSQREGDYNDLTIGELRDLKDAANMMYATGKKFDRFIGQFETADIKQAAKNFRASVEEKIGTPYAEQRRIGSSNDSSLQKIVKKLSQFPDSMIPSLVNVATLAKYLDGGKADGLFHDYIYRPLKTAEDAKFARYEKMRGDVDKLLSDHYTPKELAAYKDKSSETYFPSIDRNLTKEEVLSMALNSGNEGNLDRIRNGYSLSDEQIKSITNTLGKKDWDFVQATWDHLDTYWPEISALEMRVNGVEPGRVEPSPVQTPHGKYRGGYYPISYDFEKSSEAYKNAEQKNELYKQFSTVAAHTDRGHAKERVSSVNRPVRLSLDVMFNHLENVVHDLEFREPIIDVNRFLKQRDVRTALENSIGVKPASSIGDWLKAQGSDQAETLSFGEKAFQWTRFGTTLSTLGFTPKAFLLHLPSNVFNAAWEIGAMPAAKMMLNSMMDHVTGNSDLKDFVFNKSDRMQQRLTIRDRDIMEMSKKWQGTEAGVIPHYAFMALHFADEAVSLPLWEHTYKQNLEEHGESKAASIADETVTRTLGSGSKVDQIGLQRGSNAYKMFTMFYGWMSVMFNRTWADGKMAGLEYNAGNTGKAAAVMAKATVFAFLIPAIHEALLSEFMRNAPSGSDDDRKKRILAHMATSPLGMIPIARDVTSYALNRAMGSKGSDSLQMTPVEGALQNLLNPLADGAKIAFTHGKHFDQKYAEEAARGAAQLTGTPQQLNTWAFNALDDFQHTGQSSWKDFLSRKKKK